MAIEVRHEVPIDLLGRVGYLAGKGQRRERDIDRRNAIIMQAQQMRMAENARREALAYQRQRDEQQQELAAKELEAVNERTFGLEQMRQKADLGLAQLRGQQDLDLEGLRAGGDIEQTRLRGKQDLALEDRRQSGMVDREMAQFPVAQQAELAKLDRAHDWLDQQVAEGYWLPEQAAEAHASIEGIAMSFKPRRGLNESPYPVGRDIGDVWQDPRGGTFTRNNDGDVKVLIDPPPPPDPADKIKLITELLKLRTRDALENEHVVYTFQQAMKLAEELYEEDTPEKAAAAAAAAAATEGQPTDYSWRDLETGERHTPGTVTDLTRSDSGTGKALVNRVIASPVRQRAIVDGVKAKFGAADGAQVKKVLDSGRPDLIGELLKRLGMI